MKADRKRLKGEKTDLVNQMQQLYATLESREEQLRDFIRNYEQHRKVSAPHPTPIPQTPDTGSLITAPPGTGSGLESQHRRTAHVPLCSLGETPDVPGLDLDPEMNTPSPQS